MAVSKSWSSEYGALARRKHFSVDDANRTLPLVSRICADVVRAHEQATALHMRLEHRMPVADRDEVQQALERLVDRLADLIDELKNIGCELKDYRCGLVDFVSSHNGRDIYLCWKLGESQVEFWHELHDAVQTRQPVSLLTAN